jgi:uncharacterized protein YicC (UPF0701 family)
MYFSPVRKPSPLSRHPITRAISRPTLGFSANTTILPKPPASSSKTPVPLLRLIRCRFCLSGVPVYSPFSFLAASSRCLHISTQLGIPPTDDLAAILFKMPGIFNLPVESYDETFVAKVAETLNQALDIVDGFRIQEGNTLKKDLLHRVELILDLLEQVEPYEKSRHEVIKQRITKNLSELTSTGQYDENRFEQELIYYLEKLDITEEKVRLRQHCNYFNESCDDDQAGKKLGFIAQEMGREINTLGSKANEVNIQKLVVKMKDELEKIKEQVCNIL